MRILLRDAHYGVRMLTKTGGLTAIAVLTLALGIGANTAIFSVIRAALLTSVAIPEPDRVTMVWTENGGRGWHHLPASIPDYLDWKGSGAFAELAAFRDGGFNLRFAEQTERVDGLMVTPEMFSICGATPQLGRVFGPEEMHAGNDQVVVLRDDLWHSRFAGDPNIVGKTVVVNGAPRTVIGVLPKRFSKFQQEQLYVPLVFSQPLSTDRGTRFMGVIGRLRPGLDLAAAGQRMQELASRLGRQFPRENAGVTVQLQPIEEAFVEDVRMLLLALFGAVGFVLLIACANVANLLLARSTGRQKELAIRAALGASRGTLFRQLLTESAILALLGGIAAILPAMWGIDFISSFRLESLPNVEMAKLDTTVLLFNLVLALVTGLLFGLAPAIRVWKTNPNDILKEGVATHGQKSRHFLRSALVIGEVAMTLVLLAGAGLMVETFLRLRSAYPGFNAQGVLTMTLALSSRQYSTAEQQTAFFNRLLERVRTLPAVESAGLCDALPPSDHVHGTAMYLAGRPDPRPQDVPAVLNDAVSPDYFRAMQIPLIRGRFLSEADGKSEPLVVLVDEWTARRYWPNDDPIGKRIKLLQKDPWREIVGVVGDVKRPVLAFVTNGQVGQVYLPFAQEPKDTMSLAIRTTGDPAALIPAVRELVRSVDVDEPIFDVQALDAAEAAGMKSQRLGAYVFGGFAALALLLAVIGIYGVVAYSVGQRTREIGIRVALGAARRDVLRLLVGQGVMLALAGLGIGLVGALALTRLLSSLLYGVRASDPATFAAVSLLLAAAALLASYIPARRALKVDPMVALRYE